MAQTRPPQIYRRKSRQEKKLMSKRDKISILAAIFFVLFCFPPASRSQDNPSPLGQNFHQWGAVTLFNGLPSDSVRVVAQTPDGILWFGTDNGLARFDGR